jgi:hypothetical protein
METAPAFPNRQTAIGIPLKVDGRDLIRKQDEVVAGPTSVRGDDAVET